MIDAKYRYPGSDTVAVFTHVGGVDMCGALACRAHAIVTRTATTEYLGVIDGRGRGPDIDPVTGLANAGR